MDYNEAAKIFLGRTYSNTNSDTVLNSLVEKWLQNKIFPIQTGIWNFYYFDSKEKGMQAFDDIPGDRLFVHRSECRRVMLLDLKDYLVECSIASSGDTIESVMVRTVGSTSCPAVHDYLKKAGFQAHRKKEDKATVHFAYPQGQGKGIGYSTRHFTPVKYDTIKQNYNEKVQEGFVSLMDELKVATKGLVILHGTPGTGKTYLIRSMISELGDLRDSVICSPPTQFIEQTGMMTMALNNASNPFIILEDLGDMFQVDAVSSMPDRFSNLVNMTDGLLSLLYSSVFLLTFNYRIEKIHPALTRHGRCIAQIEVPELTSEEAEKAMPELEGLKNKTRWTLADLYAMRDGKSPKAKKERIGLLESMSRLEMPRGDGHSSRMYD